MPKVIKTRNIETKTKSELYLQYCQTLSPSERIVLLEKLSTEMKILAQAQLPQTEIGETPTPDATKGLQRFFKSLRKI
ncbi:MAG: hypothetical protein HC913_16955 [Microscillaceae bacterium]|nr:hypothetical protein [Microscillaceae bacterium]